MLATPCGTSCCVPPYKPCCGHSNCSCHADDEHQHPHRVEHRAKALRRRAYGHALTPPRCGDAVVALGLPPPGSRTAHRGPVPDGRLPLCGARWLQRQVVVRAGAGLPGTRGLQHEPRVRGTVQMREGRRATTGTGANALGLAKPARQGRGTCVHSVKQRSLTQTGAVGELRAGRPVWHRGPAAEQSAPGRLSSAQLQKLNARRPDFHG